MTKRLRELLLNDHVRKGHFDGRAVPADGDHPPRAA